MAPSVIKDYALLARSVMASPHKSLWCTYDADADVLYVNFTKSTAATDSELTDDDVIVRYDGDTVIGLTILHASRRSAA